MIRVGCCGFSTSIKEYFENLSLVKINRTFYRYPREKTVEAWRKEAPENFEFTVKAHQDISQKTRMKAEEQSLQAFEQMKTICKTLNSRILLIQTPASFNPDKLSDADNFFKLADPESLVLVLETRGPAWENHEAYENFKGSWRS
jgi:uncharacterized protein YecE (DUF72 family)